MCNNAHAVFWVREDWTGRYFQSNMTDITKAVNEINAFLIAEGDVDLNTFYDRIGLEPIPMGTEWGWSGDRVDVVYGAALGGPNAPHGMEGAPVMTLRFRDDPKPSAGIRLD